MAKKRVIRPEHQFPETRAEWELIVFKEAAYFTVVMSFGGGLRERYEYKELPSAIRKAERWEGPHGRRPTLYAVTASGRSIPLDRKEWPIWLKMWKEGKK